jgi:hypothetical protein
MNGWRKNRDETTINHRQPPQKQDEASRNGMGQVRTSIAFIQEQASKQQTGSKQAANKQEHKQINTGRQAENRKSHPKKEKATNGRGTTNIEGGRFL